jgi:FkbM family methyltransferase
MKNILYNIYKFIIYQTIPNVLIIKNIFNKNFKICYNLSQNLGFNPFSKVLNYEPTIHNNINEILTKKYGQLKDKRLFVFDIGSNIGQTAIYFKYLNTKNKVLCIEPDIDTYNLLEYNLKLNSFEDIQCLNFGVGDSNTFVDFFSDSVSGGRKGSFIEEYVGSNYTGIKKNVQIKRLDFLISEYGKPDIIKIDVEGFESNVLKGISDYQNIIFFIELREETSHFIFNYFYKNYLIYKIDSTVIEEVISVNQINEFCNIICLPLIQE